MENREKSVNNALRRVYNKKRVLSIYHSSERRTEILKDCEEKEEYLKRKRTKRRKLNESDSDSSSPSNVKRYKKRKNPFFSDNLKPKKRKKKRVINLGLPIKKKKTSRKKVKKVHKPLNL